MCFLHYDISWKHILVLVIYIALIKKFKYFLVMLVLSKLH